MKCVRRGRNVAGVLDVATDLRMARVSVAVMVHRGDRMPDVVMDLPGVRAVGLAMDLREVVQWGLQTRNGS